MSANDLKNSIVENQQVVDELNRKTREIKIIQEISMEINSILDLKSILSSILQSLDRVFDFKHSMICLPDETGETLNVTASHGYAEDGIGAEIKIGQGVIGVVAKRKKLMRMGNIGMQMAYTNNVRAQLEKAGKTENLEQKVKLPGLPNVQSQVAIPLLVKDRLIGVLAVESEKHNVFDERDEFIITIVANQAASAIENARLYEAEKNANNALKVLNENLEEKVLERTAEVIRQKEIVEEKNHEILASIQYAKRIQNAILPTAAHAETHLGEHFVLYLPKDIVSGDFYWINNKEDKTFFASIDCTGHGVPGAFMSIVAHANLQRALHVFKLRHPGEILDLMSETLSEGFKHSAENIRDGMDMSLCALNRQTLELEFAGANNGLYIINSQRNQWPPEALPFGDNMPGVEIKGDKQPIGYFENRKKFSYQTLQLQKGDMLYMFSDGYADQFGGPRKKKFTRARLKELLASIHQQPADKQKELLEQTLVNWKGQAEQIDDILVMGVRI